MPPLRGPRDGNAQRSRKGVEGSALRHWRLLSAIAGSAFLRSRAAEKKSSSGRRLPDRDWSVTIGPVHVLLLFFLRSCAAEMKRSSERRLPDRDWSLTIGPVHLLLFFLRSGATENSSSKRRLPPPRGPSVTIGRVHVFFLRSGAAEEESSGKGYLSRGRRSVTVGGVHLLLRPGTAEASLGIRELPPGCRSVAVVHHVHLLLRGNPRQRNAQARTGSTSRDPWVVPRGG